MKHLKLTSVVVLICLLSNLSFSQETTHKTSDFDLDFYLGIGFAKVKNDNQPNYNLDVIASEILLSYNFSKDIGIATGLGYLQLSGNGFNSNGNFYHERDILRIPLLLTTSTMLGEKLKVNADIGFYAQTYIEDEFQYLNSTESDIYSGWSFGFQGNIGLTYQIKKTFYLGINFATQTDLSKIETENTASSNKQKLEQINTFGLLFGFSL